MIRRFAHLFEATLHHDYDNSGEGFLLTPTSLCRRNLDRYSLLLRSIPGGVRVVAEVAESGKMVKPIDASSSLTFGFSITATRAHSMLHTGLDFAPGAASFLHFDNTVNPGTQIDGQHRLSTAANGLAQATDAVRVVPQRFAVNDTAHLPIRVLVEDRHGRSVHDAMATPIVDAREPTQGYLNHLVDLRAAGPGRYSLTIGTRKERIYCTANPSESAGIGIIEIVTGNAVTTAYNFVANDRPSPHHFAVHLPTRTATWRYIVVPRYMGLQGEELNDLSVDGTEANFEFEAGQKIETRNKETAIRFASRIAIPFNANPVLGIALKLKLSTSAGMIERTLRQDLPSAAASTLVRDGSNPADQVFSDVYIYV